MPTLCLSLNDSKIKDLINGWVVDYNLKKKSLLEQISEVLKHNYDN